MGTNELNSKVQELRELRRMADELNAEIEAITDSLKGVMMERDVEELNGTDWRITWKVVKTQRFNTKAFKASNPELYGLYQTESSSRRFIIG